ncbi:MAG: hypothetical protein U5L04_06835 [Trueperaceae bacterium]|nr:hypothetical protein [Trueperaceae bacterium]
MKRLALLSSLALLVLGACAPSTRVENNVLPTLISVTAPRQAGDQVVLQGRYFNDGASGQNRDSYVILGADVNGRGGIRISPTDWTPSRIRFNLPPETAFGFAYVVVNGVRSNGLPLNLIATRETQRRSARVQDAGVQTAADTTGADPAEATLAAASGPLPEGFEIGVSPNEAYLAQGQTQTFRVHVRGTDNNSVVWSADAGAVGGAGSEVLYTAPGTPGEYTLSVQSGAFPEQRATATVVVGEVGVSISPVVVILPTTDRDEEFTALVSGTVDKSVTWNAPRGGTIEGDGTTITFTAPEAVGSYVLEATSSFDPSKVAQAVITVADVSVSINPVEVTVQPGASETFTAIIDGVADTSVTWSTPQGGVIEGEGTVITFVAPEAAGRYTVTATSDFDPSASATATVEVK